MILCYDAEKDYDRLYRPYRDVKAIRQRLGPGLWRPVRERIVEVVRQFREKEIAKTSQVKMNACLRLCPRPFHALLRAGGCSNPAKANVQARALHELEGKPRTWL